MAQEIIPIFPDDLTPITDYISFAKQDGRIYYFHGIMPVFSHAEDDIKSFRMFTSQLVVDGNCRQVDIINAFGVTKISVKRNVKKYREGGQEAFYKKRKGPKPRVLTPEVKNQAQELLGEGKPPSQVAKKLGLKSDTLSKAIRSGRLVESKKKGTN